MLFKNRRPSARTARGTAALVLATAVLAGCGSTVAGAPVAGEVDVRKFSVGNYSTDPLEFRGTYNHELLNGKGLAEQRLSDAVAVGPDIDPSLRYSVLTSEIDSPDNATRLFAKAAIPALEDNRMMFGYSATTSTHHLLGSNLAWADGNFDAFNSNNVSPDATSVNITVLQFPDEQRALSAVERAEAADFAVAPDLNVRVALDKYPNAKAHWRPGVPTLAATIARGQYFVNVFVQQPKPELDGLKDLAQKVFAAQLPLLDQTPPLTDRDVLHLDYDPYSMVRRTLHPSDTPSPGRNEGTYAPRGYLHRVDDQPTWRKLLDDGGVDRITTTSKGALLLRARDTKAATTLWSETSSLIPGSVDKPAGVPDVSCAENPKPNTAEFSSTWDAANHYICTLRYDRYVAQVASSQLPDAQQRAAAQYALLANSQYQ